MSNVIYITLNQASVSLPVIQIYHHIPIILCKKLWHLGINIKARKDGNSVSPLSRCMSYIRAPGYQAVRAQIQPYIPSPSHTPETLNLPKDSKSTLSIRGGPLTRIHSLRSNTTKHGDSFEPVGLQQSTWLKELNSCFSFSLWKCTRVHLFECYLVMPVWKVHDSTSDKIQTLHPCKPHLFQGLTILL